MKDLNIKDIVEARERISPVLTQTSLAYSRSCSKIAGTDVFLKQENHQITGSFKIRGTMNKILLLTDEEKKRGIIAASAGNHAQGVAYSATHVGIPSKVVMPTHTPLVKITATRSYGAKVILHGDVYDESYQRALELAKEGGRVFVHPFEDPHIIAGQGSLGLEVLDQIKDLDSILIPIGGGGLISGMAMAIKEFKPRCRVIGVVPENCAAMEALFRGQYTEELGYRSSIADGTSIKKPSYVMFDRFIKKYVDDIRAVDEGTIASAMVYLLERAKTLVEGSGALPLAALMAGGSDLSLGKKTCLVLSGGNVDMNTISQVIERGLAKAGRIARLCVVVPDHPGSLNQLTNVIASERANILEVHHDRLGDHLRLHETAIEFLLETRSSDHLNKVLEGFKKVGAHICGIHRFEQPLDS